MITDNRKSHLLRHIPAFSAILLLCVAIAAAQNQVSKQASPQNPKAKAQTQVKVESAAPVEGKRARRGHRLGMTVEAQGDQGLVISKVEESAAAHKAGFREKDKIVSVDHHSFKRARQLEAYLNSHGGRPIPVLVMRDGKQQTIMYTPPYRAGDSAWLGVYLEEGENDDKGATISQIYPDGPAARAGLQPGDVVTQIDDQKIQSASDVIATVAEMEPQSQVQFVILRNDQEEKIPVTLGAHHQQAVVPSAHPETDGGPQADGHDAFDSIPPHAMRLEHDRRTAEQHQRIEEELRALREEIRQLRDEIKQSKKS